MTYTIAVFGSAGGSMHEDILTKAREVGRLIAENNCVVLTGGCQGIPYEAIKGAKEAGGETVGISPWKDLEEHTSHEFPIKGFDEISYTGLGKKGRNLVSIDRADAVIAISGRVGTLNELTIAYDEFTPIGVLDVPGFAMEFYKLTKNCEKEGAPIIVEKEPQALVKGLIKILEDK